MFLKLLKLLRQLSALTRTDTDTSNCWAAQGLRVTIVTRDSGWDGEAVDPVIAQKII